MYKTVKLYDKPEKELEKSKLMCYSEMTPYQRSFLCGLLKEKRPKKIVEIGVSAGGTTALIIQCLKMLNVNAEMYSVDLSYNWYKNEKYKVGFAADSILQNLENVAHHFLLGNAIPFFLDKIGEDIDFLILDTAHSLPGELLDFIVCLPFLKEGCIVILHDTIENHLTCRDREIATKLLFDTVKADDKYYMWEEGINVASLPNIAAFRVGKETRKAIRDVFSALTVSWGYVIQNTEKQKYREIIQEKYGNEYLEFFDRIEALQRNTFLQKKIEEHYGRSSEYLKMKWGKAKQVILYGAGYYAEVYYQWGILNHLNISGLVVSNGQEKVSKRNIKLPMYYLSELPYQPNECAIILALDKRYHKSIIQNLNQAGYDNIL